MAWLGERRGHAIDWVTQRWVELTGQRISLAQAPWLEGPSGSLRGIGADFFERWGEARGLTALPSRPEDGLIDGVGVLEAAAFDPSTVHPRINDFYAHTADFDLQLQSRWLGFFRPLGWLMARIFARRLAQLNMPLSEHDLRGGTQSRIIRLADAAGQVRHTAWVRTSVATGIPVFVGQYGIETIPGHTGPCIKVVFPLPNGNAIVLLRPRAEPEGGLSLVSDGRRFGDPGFYFTVVAGPTEVWARYVRTMKEHLTLRVDGDVVLAHHRFRVFGLPFLELRYRLERRRPVG